MQCADHMDPRITGTFIHYQGAVYLWIELLRETIGNILIVRIMCLPVSLSHLPSQEMES